VVHHNSKALGSAGGLVGWFGSTLLTGNEDGPTDDRPGAEVVEHSVRVIGTEEGVKRPSRK
jgi:hypothetical protein